MAERGNAKHGPALDEQMKHESQGMVHGTKPAHAEEWRESEPFPDDTDPAAVQEAPQTGGGAGTASGRGAGKLPEA